MTETANLTGTVDDRMRQLENTSRESQSEQWLRRQLDLTLAAWAADSTKLDIEQEAHDDF